MPIKGNSHMVAEHGVGVAKVTAGGAGVGGVSYVATEQFITQATETFTIAQAQEIAVLVASICTALYFFAAFLKTVIEIKKGKG